MLLIKKLNINIIYTDAVFVVINQNSTNVIFGNHLHPLQLKKVMGRIDVKAHTFLACVAGSRPLDAIRMIL